MMRILKSNMVLIVGTPTLLTAVMCASITSSAAAETQAPKPTYETINQLFFPCPSKAANKAWDVKNFGPVGIGITLKGTGSGFTMVIKNVEKGSPAEVTGKLKKG